MVVVSRRRKLRLKFEKQRKAVREREKKGRVMTGSWGLVQTESHDVYEVA